MAKALTHLGARPRLVAEPAELATFTHAILPGVGSFGDAMDRLESTGLDRAVLDFVRGGGHLLGICLGMQVLLATGAEGGERRGLGLIPGVVRKLDAPGLKVPHVGWNGVAFGASAIPLTSGLAPGSYFYFVHSFAAFPDLRDDWLATAHYGEPFAAIVGRGNLWGTQFHPEKSGEAGLTLLANFLALRGGEA